MKLKFEIIIKLLNLVEEENKLKININKYDCFYPFNIKTWKDKTE